MHEIERITKLDRFLLANFALVFKILGVKSE
jgi:hypothetical protein